MTAKAHGLEDECESILEATGLTEDQITLPAIGSPLSPPKPIVPTFKANWPTKATSQSTFEKALLGQETFEAVVILTSGRFFRFYYSRFYGKLKKKM